MYSTLLVPLDGSKRAEAILPYVENLAHRYGATVVLIQIVEPPVAFTGPEHLDVTAYHHQFEHRAQEARAYLDSLQEEFIQKGIECKVRIAQGAVAETIIRVASEERADLIAIASHGRTGLSQVFYGSVAAAVLNRIDRPLLVVRSLSTGK